jgi:hypothetical protein
MLRPLTLVAVGQQQDDARSALPLRFAADEELVDDDLGSVGEIAELRFPHDQHLGIVERVAVVETEHGRLGKQRIVDAEAGLLRGIEVVQRRVARARLVVVQHGVPMAERPAFAVLSAQAHGRALEQQRRVGEGLAEGPVDRPAVAQCLDAPVEQPADLRVDLEALGQGGESGDRFRHEFQRNAGRDRGV